MHPHTLFAVALAAFVAFAPKKQPPPPQNPAMTPAGQILTAIKKTLSEPKGDERNARLEQLIEKLDAVTEPVELPTKFSAHISMNNYYRGDDIDAGIIKHSTWLIEHGKTLSPELRRQFGNNIVSAYVNMAEAYAGQDRTPDAIALLKRAPVEWPDVPNAAGRVESTLKRYELVGTA